MKSVYEDTYARSLTDPAGFWAAAQPSGRWGLLWGGCSTRPAFTPTGATTT